MRELVDHKTNELNDRLAVVVADEPGSGGANHHYQVADTAVNGDIIPVLLGEIKFQNGPIKEVGVNGVTQEVLLAIVIDRLKCFQAGPYACDENKWALGYIQAGLLELQKRTRERVARGVEGTPRA